MLAGGALPEGAALVYFPIVTSTNDLAAALAERGHADSTIVVADEQLAGRGRGGHTWYSPPEAGLYTSIIVDARTGAAPADWARWLTLAAGVAISEGLHAASGLPVAIKWPNDLVIAPSGTVRGARKLGGILAEARSERGQLTHVIVGFGVNVLRSSFPPEISARATSLEDELGREVDRGRVLAASLGRFLTWLRRLRAGQTAAVVARWRELAVGGSGATIEWTRDGQRLRGVTAGIDAEGALLVRAGGATERVLGGEVVWL
jgi:BirA family biotin operon repressor/biotin-[acetyl-CoA-carboxylase] ligase